MEQRFDEGLLKQKLDKLEFWKQIIFLLVICQRMIPNFRAFSRETGFTGEQILNSLLNKAWNNLSAGIIFDNLSKEADIAESLAPDTEDFDSILVSSALDAAVATSLLMKSFCDGETNTIVTGAALIRDSVDMYVQVIEDMDPNSVDIEMQILSHELMQNELRLQREAIEFLSSITDDISISFKETKKKWFE